MAPKNLSTLIVVQRNREVEKTRMKLFLLVELLLKL
jgi:hypothetical protein